jgi:hypothetical protein
MNLTELKTELFARGTDKDLDNFEAAATLRLELDRGLAG